MGDGSYIFANPTACHQIAEAAGLSIIVIVLNNAGWGAVKASVTGLYPQGHAARSGDIPLTGPDAQPGFRPGGAGQPGLGAQGDNSRRVRDRPGRGAGAYRV